MRRRFKNKAELRRVKRRYRIRKKVSGTKERPRLSIHRSHKNLYIQFIDDISGRMMLSVSTKDETFKEGCPWGGNVEAAKKFGSYVSSEAGKKGIEKVVFDRGGYLYHGRIKALAEAARKGGLKF